MGIVRDELAVDEPEIAVTEREFERNGKVVKQKTGKIGKTKAPKKKPADNSAKEVVAIEKVEASDRPVSEPVVPAEVSEAVSTSLQDRVTTNDHLTNAMVAQVNDAGTVEKDDEQAPTAVAANSIPVAPAASTQHDDKDDDLNEKVDAQASAEAEKNEEHTPAIKPQKIKHKWCGLALEVLRGNNEPFTGGDAIILALGEATCPPLKEIHDFCSKHGLTMLATPYPRGMWTMEAESDA